MIFLRFKNPPQYLEFSLSPSLSLSLSPSLPLPLPLSMSLLSLMVFLLLNIVTQILGESSNENFFRLCQETRCSKRGPSIRFPFRLNTQPDFCGFEGFVLSCLNRSTLLHLPFSGDFYVQEISYLDNWVSITAVDHTNCPLQSFLSLNLSGSPLGISYTFPHDFTIVNCTERIAWGTKETTIGPIDCLTFDKNLVYLMDAYASMDKLPLNCRTFRTVQISVAVNSGVEKALEELLRTGVILIGWKDFDGCYDCEKSGNFCGFNTMRNATICSTPRPQSSHSAVIIGTSIGGITFLALVVLVLYKFRRLDSEKEAQLKIEVFLENYKTLNPTRYSYREIKKITSKFRNKIGQGGYGSVYKGKLNNGMPAAVKMIEHSIGNGQEFVNEVATIGRIHHFNVVRLLGFCSEGTRHALVYEFMPNESLEKFIFSKDAKTKNRPFSWEKLQQIAIGIAHGMDYLHQGCNQRILHFDIKPHNILLDHNFQPKISDFGLAKICSKTRSVVSMTAARGTAGYIAPELFSRNFGAVSDKSDVYSFGMLLLEMVGCRRNIDIGVENQSQIYFPEWIYDRLSNGEELGLEIEINGDEEIAQKLGIVALWCIQWNPVDRPSMTMVVQMLEGDSHGLRIPPKPFVSSDVEISPN